MPTITVRNLPAAVHQRLRRAARENRRSVNQQVILELAGKAAPAPVVESREERVRRVLAMVDEFRRGVPRFMSAEEIDAAKREGRR